MGSTVLFYSRVMSQCVIIYYAIAGVAAAKAVILIWQDIRRSVSIQTHSPYAICSDRAQQISMECASQRLPRS